MSDPRNSRKHPLFSSFIQREKQKAQHVLDKANGSRVRDAHPLPSAIFKFNSSRPSTALPDQGVDMHLTDLNNLKPLDIAIQDNNTEKALLLVEKGALVGEDLNKLLSQIIKQNNHIIFSSVINKTQDNENIDFKSLFNAAISQSNVKILETILPYCQFVEPSDKYIPRKLVMKATSESRDCVDLLLTWNFTVNPTDRQEKEYFLKATENGDLSLISHLLTLGIDVNSISLSTRLNLFRSACFNKNYEIVEYLLENNVASNRAIYIYTYLNIAVMNSDPIMTNLLLKYDATIKDHPKYFYILCTAVRNNCEAIVRIFLDRGVNVNDVDPEGKTLLHNCIAYNSQDSGYNIVELLLKNGAIPQIQASDSSLIFEAVKHAHHDIAQLFLDNDAAIQYIGPNKETLLHVAIQNNFAIEFIRALLERNVEVDAANDKMYTPLHIACNTPSKNQLEIIKLLLQFGANVNRTIFYENSHLLINIKNRTRKINNAYWSNGQTPLHLVCSYEGNFTVSIIELLLQYNININAQDTRGRTPLFLACETNNITAVKCLLDHHADVNRTDAEYCTPLYIAARYNRYNYEVFMALLEYGANVHSTNNQVKSVLHYIAESNNTELFNLLCYFEVNLNTLDQMGNSPLHVAVKKKCVEITELLIQQGADINILNQQNDTPLHSAIKEILTLQNYRNHRDIKGSVSWSNKIYKCKNIIAMFKKEVVKLKIARSYVDSQNVKMVYSIDHYSNYRDFIRGEMDIQSNIQQFEEKCEEEIEKLKTIKIGINSMTFHDLLRKNIHILSRFIYNKRLQEMISSNVYDDMFPLYINIIRSRCRDAKVLHTSMYYVKKYFRLNLFQRMLEDCIDDIFSYLNITDITMFLNAVKPTDE